VLRLRLAEDSLHDDQLFGFVNFELVGLQLKAFFLEIEPVAEQEPSEFGLLFLKVVRRDLVEP
jgi:hypothetical protein